MLDLPAGKHRVYLRIRGKAPPHSRRETPVRSDCRIQAGVRRRDTSRQHPPCFNLSRARVEANSNAPTHRSARKGQARRVIDGEEKGSGRFSPDLQLKTARARQKRRKKALQVPLQFSCRAAWAPAEALSAQLMPTLPDLVEGRPLGAAPALRVARAQQHSARSGQPCLPKFGPSSAVLFSGQVSTSALARSMW